MTDMPMDFAGFAARVDMAKAPRTAIAAEDGTSLSVMKFGPAAAAGTVLIYHGGGANAATGYAHLARLLATEEMAVWAVDMRGHGESGGRRGHASRPATVWADVDRLIEAALAASPETRVHLVGHSSGAGMLLNAFAGLKHRAAVAGIYFIAPQFGYRARLEVEDSAGRFAKTFVPAFVLNAMTGGAIGGGLTAVRFNYDAVDRSDALGLLAAYTVNMANAVTPQNPAAQLAQVDVPVWIAVAARDEVIDAAKLTGFAKAHGPAGLRIHQLDESGHLDAILDAAEPLQAAISGANS